ncbi:hypothetical protein M011DRAFT_275087 [Sporormia fimetaria CBS 119925]|uniref:Uncharacterized protein n=1 Tax=Sporormia fimetaria CBS 119925 TaxID=1340428 RepID=A0A6A6VKR8_9PLEO|nr:hypothetical protein M011DRAFT_275087 [Sporormia fimetaria CBS 119925]
MTSYWCKMSRKATERKKLVHDPSFKLMDAVNRLHNFHKRIFFAASPGSGLLHPHSAGLHTYRMPIRQPCMAALLSFLATCLQLPTSILRTSKAFVKLQTRHPQGWRRAAVHSYGR